MRWRSVSLWGPALSVLLLVGVLRALHKELVHVSYTELTAAFHDIPGTGIAAAIALTLLNYLVLSGYEVLACRYVDKPQPFRRILGDRELFMQKTLLAGVVDRSGFPFELHFCAVAIRRRQHGAAAGAAGNDADGKMRDGHGEQSS